MDQYPTYILNDRVGIILSKQDRATCILPALVANDSSTEFGSPCLFMAILNTVMYMYTVSYSVFADQRVCVKMRC